MAFYQLDGFDPRLVGWIVNFARKNYYRVAEFMDLTDLVHEGFDCLLDARRRYSHYEPRRFSNTVKLMFSNQIPYLLNRNIRMPVGHLRRFSDMVEPEKVAAAAERLIGEDEDARLRQVIADAPPRVKLILEAYLDPEHPMQDRLMRDLRRFRNRAGRETLNEKLCSIVGADPDKVDVRQEIREYLSVGE